MHQRSLKEKAVALRISGYTYAYICKTTGLSKSTLSGWLASVPYKPNQETIQQQGSARSSAGREKAERRRRKIQDVYRIASDEIGELSNRDLFMFGLGLYLGEGSKTHQIVRATNSDPKTVRAIVAWFRLLGIRDEQIAPRLHAYPDSDIQASLQFWSRTIRIPVAQFLKTQIDKRKGKRKQKRGKLPYGTLHIGIRSAGRKEYGVVFFHRIQGCTEAVIQQITKRD